MPTLTIDATAHPREGGARVLISINGTNLPSIGPFTSIDEAERAAKRVIDEVSRDAISTAQATMADDVADPPHVSIKDVRGILKPKT